MTVKNRIGTELSGENSETFASFNAATLKELPDRFHVATPPEVERAMLKAKNAYAIYKQMSGSQKALFLDAIATEIEALGDKLVDMACQETALSPSRIQSERTRTVNQLRMYGELLREGSWVDASIDTAIPGRTPVPKPDLRRMFIPIGPVVVFSASNFPLAYSTAGGDTVSALAAGNPVVVKAHPSHAGTNNLVSEAINTAGLKTSMPDGVFSTLYSNAFELGIHLVKHPVTAAIGFTGSFTGGMALFKAASEREVPIPVFAEMGSTNPVVILPEKLGTDQSELVSLLTGAVTNGAGQFCTKPGLIAAIQGSNLDQFVTLLARSVTATESQSMLNTGIQKGYNEKTEALMREKGITLYSDRSKSKNASGGIPHIATVDYSVFAQNRKLHEEVFGPFTLVIRCNNENELAAFTASLGGQLTFSVFGTDKDIASNLGLFSLLREKAGRIILNGVPTGVEVCPSMQHGGPFPASTDGRFTSVGTDAIRRFVRPVAFQNTPPLLLPDELKDENPLDIWRKVNGEFSKGRILIE